ncbi:hypothetical protein HDU67_009692 [Dinochytrium kinnereticum]|nr:hypothetical protein HDU67_009692 [Dinochytrium kinnereticum]
MLTNINTRYLLVGTAFGFVLEKSKVYVPAVIVSQMQMTNFVMMQVFVTATVTGMVFMSVAEYLKFFKRSPRPFTAALCGSSFSYTANAIGGALVGAGMALSGACPGTIFAQLGTATETAWWTLLGAMLASVSYGYAHRLIQSVNPCFGKTTPTNPFDGGKTKHYLLMAAGATVAATGGLIALNKFAPWEQDFEAILHIGKNVTVPVSATSLAWDPITSGLGIGFVQLLSLIFTASSIGASSVFPYVGANVAAFFDKKIDENAPFCKTFLQKSETLFMAMGIVAGSAISAYVGGVSSSAIASSVGLNISPLRAVIGGVSLVYGSRIAGGCTSGHGLSGMAQLSPASFVTVASMFLGGFAASKAF